MPKYKKKSKVRRSGAKRSRSSVGALAKAVKALQSLTPKAQALRRARFTRRAYRRFNAPGPNPEGAYAQHIEHFKAQFPELEGLSNGEIGKMIGKGGYWGARFGRWLGGLTGNNTIKSMLTGAFDHLGDVVADAVPYGNEIAAGTRMIAEAIPSLRGSGAYDLSSRQATESMQVGSFQQGDVEVIRVRSREYLGSVLGSEGYSVRTLPLNPGSIQTFPGLSKLAMHYEMYRMNGLVFWYHSTSGESTNSANTAIGEVMMANQPDSTASVPADKYQLVRLNGSKQAKPSVDQLHGVECAGNGVKFIRHGDLIESRQDAARFDEGSFHIAVEGCNAAVTRIGELWVTYDVELIRSRDSAGQEVTAYAQLASNCIQNSVLTGAGPSSVTLLANSLPMTVVSGTTIRFPNFVSDGDWMVTVTLSGSIAPVGSSSFVAIAPNIDNLVNCQLIDYHPAQFGQGSGQGGDFCSRDVTCTGVVRLSAPGTAFAEFRLSGSVFPWVPVQGSASSGQCRIMINRIPNGVLTNYY